MAKIVKKKSPALAKPTPPARAKPTPKAEQELRERQKLVASIVEKYFGKFAESNPRLWDQRAYVMLIGLVYDRLTGHESAISIRELTALTKILADSGRAEVARRKTKGRRKAQPTKDNGPLSEQLGEMVQQVYGVK